MLLKSIAMKMQSIAMLLKNITMKMRSIGMKTESVVMEMQSIAMLFKSIAMKCKVLKSIAMLFKSIAMKQEYCNGFVNMAVLAFHRQLRPNKCPPWTQAPRTSAPGQLPPVPIAPRLIDKTLAPKALRVVLRQSGLSINSSPHIANRLISWLYFYCCHI